MKTFIKLIIVLFAVSISGCWNMYNDANEDMDIDYNFYLLIANTNTTLTTSYISTFSVAEEGSINPVNKSAGFGGTLGYYPAVHPNNKYLYVPDRTNGLLNIYSIGADGSLNLISNTTVTGSSPYAVKVHPTGNFVYVTNTGTTTGSISMFRVNNDYTLTEIASPIATEANFRPFRMSFNPTGNILYVTIIYPTSNYCNVASYNIAADGSLSALESSKQIVSIPGENSNDVIVHPNGQYIYVSLSNGYVYKCSLLANGTINTITYQNDSGTNPFFAIHPTGNYLFIASIIFVSAFQISATDGTLGSNGGLTSTGHRDIAIHPNGKYLYTANSTYGERYNINEDGTITRIDLIDYSANDYIANPWGLVLIKKKN